MVATRKVDQKGRVVVPERVIREIGGKPGDTVTFQTTGRGTVELIVVGATRATTVAPGTVATDAPREPGGAGKQPDVDAQERGEEFVPMTLAEMIERFPIEGPIDEAADRELWEAEAAKDVFGSRHD